MPSKEELFPVVDFAQSLCPLLLPLLDSISSLWLLFPPETKGSLPGSANNQGISIINCHIDADSKRKHGF